MVGSFSGRTLRWQEERRVARATRRRRGAEDTASAALLSDFSNRRLLVYPISFISIAQLFLALAPLVLPQSQHKGFVSSQRLPSPKLWILECSPLAVVSAQDGQDSAQVIRSLLLGRNPGSSGISRLPELGGDSTRLLPQLIMSRLLRRNQLFQASQRKMRGVGNDPDFSYEQLRKEGLASAGSAAQGAFSPCSP